MRQLSYTRVSTPAQDARMQLDALLAVGVERRDVFSDVTSGNRTAIERPGIKKLLEYAEAGDTVVVWRIDHLGRSLIDVLNTEALLREREINVRSTSDGIDPTTSTGRLMLNMLATLAEYERELILERINPGIAAARENDTRFGRPVSDPVLISEKLAIVEDARSKGHTPRRQHVSSDGAVQRATATSRPSTHAETPHFRQLALTLPGSTPHRCTIER